MSLKEVIAEKARLESILMEPAKRSHLLEASPNYIDISLSFCKVKVYIGLITKLNLTGSAIYKLLILFIYLCPNS